MARAVVLLAEGFEEIEAVTPIDVLRRAGVDVVTAGVGGTRVVGAHGVAFEADTTAEEAPTEVDAVVLPGGMPGAENLAKSPAVLSLIEKTAGRGKLVAAICASPAVVLSRTKLLEGKKVTCYPGFEERLPKGAKHTPERVVVDGKLITSRGPGTALEFSLALVSALVDEKKAGQLREGMIVKA